MARIRLDTKKVYTWKSPVGNVREGCVIIKNLHNDFAYRIKDMDGKFWLAYPSELKSEIVEEVKEVNE